MPSLTGGSSFSIASSSLSSALRLLRRWKAGYKSGSFSTDHSETNTRKLG